MRAIKSRISIFSDNPDELSEFYTKILGFKLCIKIDKKDDYGFSIEIAPGYKIWIAKHSQIYGKNTDPFRLIISIYVDNIHSYFDTIAKYNPELINEEPILVCRDIKSETRWAGSFFDTDGNCIQMMQMVDAPSSLAQNSI